MSSTEGFQPITQITQNKRSCPSLSMWLSSYKWFEKIIERVSKNDASKEMISALRWLAYDNN